MKEVHVECFPDEVLVKKLGIARKQITHHSGKSRVFAKLKTSKLQIALVDEDPGSAKCGYENSLIFVSKEFGISEWKDKSGNKVLVLKGKLEDWIITTCKAAKIDIQKDFGLPTKPNVLHEVINDRIGNFEKLIDYLLEKENTGIQQLKDRLR